MKPITALLAVFLAATTFGCNEAAPPKSDLRVESASEAARNDDRAIAVRLAAQKAAVDAAFQRQRAREQRQQNVEALLAVSTRWETALNEANLTARSDIAGPIRKLSAIKADADTVVVDDCTGGARTTLVSAMAASIEAFNMFQKETGASGAATAQKVQQAADLLGSAQGEISACLTK